MAHGHSTDVRLKDNPHIQDLGGGYICNADGQIVRAHISHGTRPAIIRFLEKTCVSEVLFYNGSPCWEWIGCKSKTTGYGQFKSDGRRGAKKSSPHRFSHEYFIGPIPDSYEADHLCKVRHCCNPLHLEAVTLQVNRKRKYADKTHCKNNHPLEGDNLFIRADGARGCRACQRDRTRAFHAKNPEYNAEMCKAYQIKRANITPDEDAT